MTPPPNKPKTRRHVFSYGPHGSYRCKRCGVERRTAIEVKRDARVFVLYRDVARSEEWTTARPICSGAPS